jgi:hypothetical protein
MMLHEQLLHVTILPGEELGKMGYYYASLCLLAILVCECNVKFLTFIGYIRLKIIIGEIKMYRKQF